MKLIERIKTLELLIFVGISGLCFYMIVVESNVYHLIADSKELQLVCGLLWGSLFVAFIFIFIDLSLYSTQKKAINALDYAVHSDNLAKIANRQGIDEIIDKYVGMPLPENMGCAMFILTSLNDVNATHTRADGNTQIRNFSIILKLASVDVCFVGRNGGNVFMAIFENANSMQVEAFMDRIAEKVREYNRKKDNLPMYYQVGLAYHEDQSIDSINKLISLASQRSRDGEIIPSSTPKITVKVAEPEIPKEQLEDTKTNIEQTNYNYEDEISENYSYSDEEIFKNAEKYD